MPPPPRAGIEAARAAIPPRPAPAPRVYPTRAELLGRGVGAEKRPKNAADIAPGKRNVFTTRHQLILWMDVAGMRVVDIALRLEMHPTSISAIRSSPLYNVHKQQLMEQMKGFSFENMLDLIRSDAVKNVQFAIDVRSNELQDTKERLGAARLLQKEADRVYPRMTNSKHTEERVVRIEIGGEQMRRISNAMREIGAPVDEADIVEPEFTPVNDGRPPIEAKSIDAMREDLLRAAAQQSG